GPERAALRPVSGRVEHEHVRRAHADAEGVQRPLVGLVGRAARDREALEPAFRDLAGGEAAEEGEYEPGADDGVTVTSDDVSETGEQACSFRVGVWAVRPAKVAELIGPTSGGAPGGVLTLDR